MRFYENLAFLLETLRGISEKLVFLLETLQDSTRIYILRESLQKQAKILHFTRIHILRDSADSIDKILQIRKNLAFWILQNHNVSINSQESTLLYL